MRYAGAIMIFLACAGGGFYKAMQIKSRVRTLSSLIAALELLKEPCEVALYTDSQYLCNAINKGWLKGWKAKGWKRKEGELKNPDLWQRLDALLATHAVTFFWVKGHADNAFNNRCDALAVAEREKFAR